MRETLIMLFEDAGMPHFIKGPIWSLFLLFYSVLSILTLSYLDWHHSILWVLATVMLYSFMWDASLSELVWRYIPDRCEMPFCSRKGRRYEENFEDGKYVCDYCSVRYFLMKQGAII